MKRIYLDHNATTPVRAEVKDAVMPFLMENYGNASSRHLEGRVVRTAVEKAREQVAAAINARPENIIFNSCATEGNNAVLRGYWINYKEKMEKNHIIISAVEHPAVLETAKYLSKNGFEVTKIPVDNKGRIDLAKIEKAIKPNTGLISVMMVNNETGNIYPVKEIASIARKNNILFHTDAVQAAGKILVDVTDIKPDFLTISGHKFYALKGSGALYMRKGLRLEPFIIGGHQELAKRAGTENVVGIIAMGTAISLAVTEMNETMARIGKLRDMLEKKIVEEVPYTTVLGDPENRVSTTTNISFRFVEGEGMMLKLDYFGIALSTGSACSSGSLQPSHVITAMSVDKEEAHSSLRFSLGKSTTEEDIIYTAEKVKEIVAQLRSFSPLYDTFINRRP